MSPEFTYEELLDMYNNAPCGYHSLDNTGLFLHINDTELKWLGYSREEVVGKKHWVDVIDEKSQINFKEKFPIYLKEGHIENVEFSIVSKPGVVTVVLANATAVKDASGNILYSRSVLIDITSRIQLDEELKERMLEIEKTNQIMVNRELKMIELKKEIEELTAKLQNK